MNPYSFVLATIPTVESGNIEMAALRAVLQLMGEAYSSGFTRGPDNEFDYVVCAVNLKFGPAHPVSYRVATMFQHRLGRG